MPAAVALKHMNIGKTMMRILCFDHITTATTPLPNLYRMKGTSYNYKVI